MRASSHEEAIKTNTRFYAALAMEGYLPVFNKNDEKCRAVCPEGFFMMEYRRIDNPAYRVITSLSKNAMLAHFEEVALTGPSSPVSGLMKRLMNCFSLASKTAPAASNATKCIMTFAQALDLLEKNGHFPLGTPAPRHYRDLSIGLYEDMRHSDHEKRAGFGIDPDKITNGYVELSGSINPARPLYAHTRTDNEDLFAERLVGNTMLLIKNSRTVQLIIPTAKQESQGVYIKAGNTFKGGQTDTVIQNVPLPVFTATRHEMIAQHVKGRGVPAFKSTPNGTLF